MRAHRPPEPANATRHTVTMSTLRIEEKLTLPGPPERVWAHLIDPASIVGCLPGATLTSSSDDGRSHEGTVKVKLGALTVAYRGAADFVEVDEAAWRVRVEAKGRERTGAGQVSMTMVGRVAGTESGAELLIDADVKLAGKIVTFGRGMIEVVTRQIIKDFSACLSQTLVAHAAEDEAERVGMGADPEGAYGPSPAAEAPPLTAESANALLLLARAVRTWLREALGMDDDRPS